jgi:hypothetical protein
MIQDIKVHTRSAIHSVFMRRDVRLNLIGFHWDIICFLSEDRSQYFRMNNFELSYNHDLPEVLVRGRVRLTAEDHLFILDHVRRHFLRLHSGIVIEFGRLRAYEWDFTACHIDALNRFVPDHDPPPPAPAPPPPPPLPPVEPINDMLARARKRLRRD